MYSFEGDYKRKPVQCLSGASIKTERTELLQHVRNQRQKREEQRKRAKSTVLIQAFVRSYIARTRVKKCERNEFTIKLNSMVNQNVNEVQLSELLHKLLFFFNKNEDNVLLTKISQMVLQLHAQFIKLTTSTENQHIWRIKRLLNLNLQQLVHIVRLESTDSMAISLRLLEVFTSLDTVTAIIGPDNAQTFLAKLFEFLMDKGYFEKIRFLLDKKTPVLVQSSPNAPTPLVSCLFDMLRRPLLIGNNVPASTFSKVLRGLCKYIFSLDLTEPIKLFVIPALSLDANFPFFQMIEALRNPPMGASDMLDDQFSILPTTGLLYAVLCLGKQRFIIDKKVRSVELISYLQVLSTLTSNISKLGLAGVQTEDDEDDEDGMNDVDMEKTSSGVLFKEEIQALNECVDLLNDTQRVEDLLLAVDRSEDPLILQPLCQVCHNLLVSNRSAVRKYRLIHLLAFKPTFLRNLWNSVQRISQTSLFGYATPLINIISRGIPMSTEETDRIVPILAVFCSLCSLNIGTWNDAEFYNDENNSLSQLMPFTLNQLVAITSKLKDVSLGLVDLAFPDSRSQVRQHLDIDGIEWRVSAQHTHLWSHLFRAVVSLMRQLYARDSRRPFCPEGHWISSQVQVIFCVHQPVEFVLRRRRLRDYRPFAGVRAFTREELEEGPPLTTKEIRTATLLNELPFLVAFEERVMIFQTIVLKDKYEHQGERANFLQGPYIQISVRRQYLYEDTFDKLSYENEPELRKLLKVKLINSADVEEAGIDGGGLLREFLSELLKTAFDPNRGFFKLTNDNLLYPNPGVSLLVENFTKHYFFIGRILGKALYENLLCELPLADFFLSKIVGKHSDVDIHNLASLDPIMYRNLLFLESYEGDVLDLGLDFTIMNQELGETRVEELKPGGCSIPVTSTNRIEYIALMADYKLNKQIRAQCNAFRKGLSNVIPLEWIQMFNNKELQVLISGAEIPVNVDDLRKHTNYAGGYTEDHLTITLFWKVVSNFTDLQKRQLLKFVTSCSRPPLLGFKELDPPFCIHHAGSIDRLPTASTCMNLLKLPEFPNETLMTEKLLYAIQSASGFELS